MSIPGVTGFDTNCGYVAHDGTAKSVGLSQNYCLVKSKYHDCQN